MILTRNEMGTEALIPLTKDLRLMIKSLECYSQHVSSPEQEAEQCHCDALCCVMELWLLLQETEMCGDIEQARKAVEKRSAA